MKKVIFVTAMAALCALRLNAQDAYTMDSDTPDKMFIWSIGIEPSIPVGHFNEYSGFGLGGSVQGEYKATRMLGITVNAGYVDYFGTTADGISYNDFQYWPVMGGLKLYMGKMAYIHGQAGAGFGTQDLGNSFWYGGGVGLNLSKAIDVEVRYAGWEQSEVENEEADGGNGYGAGSGAGGGTGGGYGGYGGHYSTIGLRVAYNF